MKKITRRNVLILCTLLVASATIYYLSAGFGFSIGFGGGWGRRYRPYYGRSYGPGFGVGVYKY